MQSPSQRVLRSNSGRDGRVKICNGRRISFSRPALRRLWHFPPELVRIFVVVNAANIRYSICTPQSLFTHTLYPYYGTVRTTTRDLKLLYCIFRTVWYDVNVSIPGRRSRASRREISIFVSAFLIDCQRHYHCTGNSLTALSVAASRSRCRTTPTTSSWQRRTWRFRCHWSSFVRHMWVYRSSIKSMIRASSFCMNLVYKQDSAFRFC